MSPALLDALPDFGAAAASSAMGHGEPSFTVLHHPAGPDASLSPAPDEGETIAARIAAAQDAVAGRMRFEHEAALAAERERHAQELDMARQTAAEQMGERIGARFEELERSLATLTSQAVARMLGVVLTQDLQRRSIAELERIIRAALDERETVRIRLSGAPLLWEALRRGLGDKADHVDFAEAPGMNISLSVDERLYETRLAEWSDTLAELIP